LRHEADKHYEAGDDCRCRELADDVLPPHCDHLTGDYYTVLATAPAGSNQHDREWPFLYAE